MGAVQVVARELTQPSDQARALHGLALVRQELGQLPRARRHWKDALDILTGIGATQVEELSTAEIRAHLAALDRHERGEETADGTAWRPRGPAAPAGSKLEPVIVA